jgi:hypothetical protein
MHLYVAMPEERAENRGWTFYATISLLCEIKLLEMRGG